MFFMILGAGVLSWGYHMYHKTEEAKAWPTTTGRVITSEVKSQGSTRMYKPAVQYGYTVGGKNYLSSHVSFAEYSSSHPSRAQSIISKYPVGATILVHYQPQNPDLAVLDPGDMGGIYIPFVIGSFFMLFSVVGLIQLTRNT